MKKPNSRRSKVEEKHSPQWENEAILRARHEVGIDFVCSRGHTRQLVGQFRMSTADGEDRRLQVVPIEGTGLLPEEAGRLEGEAKALLVCPKCRHNKQVSEAKLKAGLDALWSPRHARVVAVEI